MKPGHIRARLAALFLAAAAPALAGCASGPADSGPESTGVYINAFGKAEKSRFDHLKIEDRCASAIAENAAQIKNVRLVAPVGAEEATELGTRWELYCEEKGRTLEVSPGKPDVEFGGDVAVAGNRLLLKGWFRRGESVSEQTVEGEVNSAGEVDPLARELALRLLSGCFPAETQLHMKLGITLSRGGLPSRAIDAYRKLLSIDPGNAAAHFNMGLAYDRLGETEAANAAYRKAVEARPDYYQAIYNLGLNFISAKGVEESPEQRKERFGQGAQCLRRVVEINPRHKEARYMLAETLDMLGRFTEAMDECAEIVRIFPADAPAYRLSGSVALKLGRGPEALAFFKKAA